jgi:hypothetical protein
VKLYLILAVAKALRTSKICGQSADNRYIIWGSAKHRQERNGRSKPSHLFYSILFHSTIIRSLGDMHKIQRPLLGNAKVHSSVPIECNPIEKPNCGRTDTMILSTSNLSTLIIYISLYPLLHSLPLYTLSTSARFFYIFENSKSSIPIDGTQEVSSCLGAKQCLWFH